MSESDQLIKSTDFEIKSLALTSSNGNTVDIRGLMEELNLFDSIMDQTISGNILINDSLGIIKKMPIIGNELLEVHIVKPGTNGKIRFKKVFRIYSLTDRRSDTNTSESYILNFCSEDYIFSNQVRISKGFKNKLVSDMVEDILKNTLRIKNKPKSINYHIEPTVGPQNLVIPNLNPLEACAWLAKRSLNSKMVPSYVFFESLVDGFVFYSYQTLLKQNALDITYKHSIKNITDQGQGEEMFGTRNSEIDSGFNILKGIKEGVYASTLIGVDLASLSFDKKEFDAEAYYDKIDHLNKNTNKISFKNRSGSDVVKESMANIKVIPLRKDPQKVPYMKEHDTGALPTNMDQIVLERQNIFHTLFNNKIYMNVAGLQEISSGKIITIEFLDRKVREEGNREEEKLTSGKYLITSTRHKFTYSKYETYFEAVTDSTDQKISKGSTQRYLKGIDE